VALSSAVPLPLPPVLPGALAGFISPASPPEYYWVPFSDYVPHVNRTMESLNLGARFAYHSFSEWGYLAGHDDHRAQDVMTMFLNPDISLIIANRGGFGCGRILQLLNYSAIAQNPKPLIGYSDLTALLTAITVRTGMVTFHGPMGINEWNGTGAGNTIYFQDVILNQQLTVFKILDGHSVKTINSGKASGKLWGGNLSVFVSLIGSIFFPSNFTGAILFLEDTTIYPYQFDRCLTQLALAGVLQQISGFVFGRCTLCNDTVPANQTFSIHSVVHQHVAPLGIPAFDGAKIGHIDAQYTLPIGGMVEIDADLGTITMLESPFASSSKNGGQASKSTGSS